MTVPQSGGISQRTIQIVMRFQHPPVQTTSTFAQTITFVATEMKCAGKPKGPAGADFSSYSSNSVLAPTAGSVSLYTEGIHSPVELSLVPTDRIDHREGVRPDGVHDLAQYEHASD